MLTKRLHPSQPPAGEPAGPAIRPYIQGQSPQMCSVQRLIAEIAPTDIPVLILGESGTGKEIAAWQIHTLSKQRSLPFIKITCAKYLDEQAPGLSLLGCPNGDGTGGKETGGTVFLDELGELDTDGQRHLLHAIPDDNGVLEHQTVAGRIVSCTRQDLESEVRRGRFRNELFYRLNGFSLWLPPLRHRKDDIPLLANHFLRKYADIFRRGETHLSESTMQALGDYAWPGNIRELENVVKKIVALESEQLGIADLKARGVKPGPSESLHTQQSLKQAARAASYQAERELILRTLSQTHWNRKKAAAALQISYKSLLFKLKQIQVPEIGDV